MPPPDCPLPASLRAGIARDLLPFEAHSITRHALLQSLERIHRAESDIMVTFGIYNNTLHWLQPQRFLTHRSPLIYAVADDLQTLIGMHSVPDVEFVLNVDDYPKARSLVAACAMNASSSSSASGGDGSSGRCGSIRGGTGGRARVPMALFSFTKHERPGEQYGDLDILIPSGSFRMSSFEGKLLARSPEGWRAAYPWASKRSAAFFRGTPYCGQHNFGRCSRYALAHLSAEQQLARQRSNRQPQPPSQQPPSQQPPSQQPPSQQPPSQQQQLRRERWQRLASSPTLDVGLVEYNPSHDTERSRGVRTYPLPKAARKPDSVLGHYKWLLHLDGHSFSNRLQGLLLTNSLVLKQDSPYIEYYYRALQPWRHYVPFYRTSAEDVLEALRNVSENDALAEQIARSGQAAAHTLLHVDARMCYWRRLLHGWSRRLADRPTPDAWPHARPVVPADYVCGECRRPPNPELIGPWAEGHPCTDRRRGELNSVQRCRQEAAAAATAAHARGPGRQRI